MSHLIWIYTVCTKVFDTQYDTALMKHFFEILADVKDKVHEGTKSALSQKLMKFGNIVCACLR